MKPPAFQLLRARSVAECLDALADPDRETKVIAGGQSLMPLLNLRLARPERLIDINAVRELATLEVGPQAWRIGALVRHRSLETDEKLTTLLPIVPRVVSEIGHLAIRNRGTLGGTLAHADSAAELPALMLLLGAEVTVTSLARGHRRIPIEEFFLGPLTTVLSEDELLTDITVPRPTEVEWHGFYEYATRVGDFARVAVLLKLRAGGSDDASDVLALRYVLFGSELGGLRYSEQSVETGTLPPLSLGDLTRSQALIPSLAADLADQLLDAGTAGHATISRLARHWVQVVTARAAADLVNDLATHRAQQNRRDLDVNDATTVEGDGGHFPPAASEPRDTMVLISVNGNPDERRINSRLTLADYLRDELRLTGTHVGCEQGVCGACTVLVNGASARSCLTLAAQVDGSEVTTVEGLADDSRLNALQRAFADHDALQCGFCTPGMLMTCTEIMSIDGLTTADLAKLLSGNLCRCTGYQGILSACQQAYRSIREDQ